ncbi:protein kinase-like protein [Acinetobacter calcoaceticus]|uniref:Protein kinase-like protein n=1 Tax=Acinetobacter calcoaceticus TaxID=471 RepID=A0A4R1XSD4_ACICA|nr:protein kinase-like protein [Acinetobacter calcoaceticus]
MPALKLNMYDQLQQPNFELASNSALSQGLGRRLYLLKADPQQDQHPQAGDAWLKLHLHGYNALSEQSFLHELHCYQHLGQLQQPKKPILLPYQIIDLKQHFDFSQQPILQPSLDQALLIPDARALFAAVATDLSDDQCLQVMIQSLAVLEHLHSLGYLHADLKIEHFRILDRKCYLIDFEQAVALEHKVLPNVAHTATPRYMAPELFHAQAKSIQSEIYALGIIWYQWLTQHRVQQGSYLDWAVWHCQDFQPQLSGRFKVFEPMLLRMLSKKTSLRYENISEIKQAISRFV